MSVNFCYQPMYIKPVKYSNTLWTKKYENAKFKGLVFFGVLHKMCWRLSFYINILVKICTVKKLYSLKNRLPVFLLKIKYIQLKILFFVKVKFSQRIVLIKINKKNSINTWPKKYFWKVMCCQRDFSEDSFFMLSKEWSRI